MFEILDITEPEAKVLRAIAHYEVNSKTKGATSYLCNKKVPNGFHISTSTFSEHIKDLENKLLVFPYNSEKKSIHNPIHYTITDLGQVAWLRYFPNSENLDIIKTAFPKILLSDIDKIIEEIASPVIKGIKNGFSLGLLRIALDSYHIFENILGTSKMKLLVEERIELSGFNGLIRTSYGRYFNAVDPKLLKELEKNDKEFSRFTKNFDQLEISVIDRVTFLFYYNLIQLVTDTSSLMIFTRVMVSQFDNSVESGTLVELIKLSKLITKKRNKILEIINSKTEIMKIMKDNLKDLNNYKDKDFKNIFNIFL